MEESFEAPRSFESLLIYLVRQQSRDDAVLLYQDEFGVSRAIAETAIDDLAVRVGVDDQPAQDRRLLLTAVATALLAYFFS